MKKVNLDKCYYVVDVDIKGFFDNVNHGKLLKQLWTLGIRDKKLICIISKMLKAEISGIGIPDKGTPQGGILSPLLANIVLNELDYWISSQWENMKTKTNYYKNLKNGNKIKYKALRKSKLKEMYIVRYADDFKILCKSHKTALKIYNATKKWLKERLNLEMSEEKSGITNIKKKAVDFLGISLKAEVKRNKYVIQSHVSTKSKKKIKDRLKNVILRLQKKPNIVNVDLYNSTILGIQNYYKIATQVNIDLAEIEYILSKKLKNRVKSIVSKTGIINKVFEKYYHGFKGKKMFIAEKVLFPLSYIKTNPPLLFKQEICNFTEEGRKIIHENIAYVNPKVLKYLMINPEPYKSTLFNDNRLSLYAGQKGLCGITKEVLRVGYMEVHHINPVYMSNKIPDDRYKNLIFVTNIIHDYIHKEYIENNMSCWCMITKLDKDYEYLHNLNDVTLERLNKYRNLAGNSSIIVNSR